MVDYASYVMIDPDINLLKCTVFIRILETLFLAMEV